MTNQNSMQQTDAAYVDNLTEIHRLESEMTEIKKTLRDLRIKNQNLYALREYLWDRNVTRKNMTRELNPSTGREALALFCQKIQWHETLSKQKDSKDYNCAMDAFLYLSYLYTSRECDIKKSIECAQDLTPWCTIKISDTLFYKSISNAKNNELLHSKYGWALVSVFNEFENQLNDESKRNESRNADIRETIQRIAEAATTNG